MVTDIYELLSAHGTASVMLAVFAGAVFAYVYRDWARLSRLEERLDAQDEFIKTTLHDALLESQRLNGQCVAEFQKFNELTREFLRHVPPRS